MLTAALLELVGDPDAFVARLNELGVPHVEWRAAKDERCGVAGTRVSVLVDGAEEYDALWGSEQESDQGLSHRHGDGNDHPHGNSYGYAHSGMHDVEQVLSQLALPESVASNVREVYRRIAEAESAVHGVPVDQVHFHEVGQADAVADVVAVCLLMDELDPDSVVVSPVHVGSGTVACAHGILPVPAPATALILKDAPIYGGEVSGELCTPTGAALLMHFATSFGPLPPMAVKRIGYGLGKREFDQANCVRALWGQAHVQVQSQEQPQEQSQAQNQAQLEVQGQGRPEAQGQEQPLAHGEERTKVQGQGGPEAHDQGQGEERALVQGKPDLPQTRLRAAAGAETAGIHADGSTDKVVELSCTVDDMTAEAIGFALEQLYEVGALEAYAVPATMKKSRPGTVISVLCQETEKDTVVCALFAYTTTLGVREALLGRYVLDRAIETFDTPFGPVRSKRSGGWGVEREKYEFDDLARIARQRGCGLEEARALVKDAAWRKPGSADQGSLDTPRCSDGMDQG
ncbi:MAG: LarC family nickel insertion protein, partial [Eggerthellaceae bacterium]|nr:LarC family nickel insertion protein [Eggerthellaceae bacterium]